MKVTYNWLKDFVDIEDTPEQLADKLTNSGFEVEELIYQNEHLHHVKVGRIEKITKHPAADKLQICDVNLGNERAQIITAATNIFEGAVVPVSLPGADLANGVKIQKSKLRGVDSDGMFCSGEELGIDDSFIDGASVDGILILPKDMTLGEDIDKALGLDDTILDINITPNRPDCMSVIGIAREICAIYGKPFKNPNLDFVTSTEKVENEIKVERKSDACLRYMAAVIKNVKIEKSPEFIRHRLFAVGIKSINTMVDLTNYVLIEMGQPMHAFDKKMIGGGKIVVRMAKEGEKIEALNHSSYALSSSDLVIADQNKAMVIAGVIGGVNSSITPNTKDVVIESAVFDLKSIRLTSRRIGVRTDSSARYEKGVSFFSAEDGMRRLLSLVCQLKLGTIVSGLIDEYASKPKQRSITCTCKQICDILGIKIADKDIVKILSGLGLMCKLESGKLTAVVPLLREDLENEYDLAEEVIRIYGYDAYDGLQTKLFEHSVVTEGKLDNKTKLERKIKNSLVANGFYEALNFSLCPPDICEKLNITDNRRFMIKIANPISEEVSHLRSTMAHSLLSSIAYNISVGNKEIDLFEAGRVYQPVSLPLSELPVETNYVALASTDKDFYEFKGAVLNAIEQTGLKYTLARSKQTFLHPGRSADVVDESGNIYASFGQIHPIVAKNYDIPKTTMYGEINLDALIPYLEKHFMVKAVSKFPIVERDLAIVVKEEIANADLTAAIKSACGKLFYEVKLFDVYRSESLGSGVKSLAYNIKLSDENKTLTDQEVTDVMARVIKALKFRYGANLR